MPGSGLESRISLSSKSGTEVQVHPDSKPAYGSYKNKVPEEEAEEPPLPDPTLEGVQWVEKSKEVTLPALQLACGPVEDEVSDMGLFKEGRFERFKHSHKKVCA